MNWEKAETAIIDDMAYYLVQDNGGEWRDLDLSVQKGYLVRGRLDPRFVRGRPEWIAKITRPSSVASGSSQACGADLYAWPIGCKHPNSCHRHGECMYVSCNHYGKPIASVVPPAERGGKA